MFLNHILKLIKKYLFVVAYAFIDYEDHRDAEVKKNMIIIKISSQIHVQSLKWFQFIT